MTATRNNPDPLFKHVVSTVLDDKAPIKTCLSGLGINTYRVLVDLMKDHNKFNSLKWRSGSTDEDLPSMACVTNQAEGERSVNVTKSTIINTMRSNSLRNRNPFDSARRMSTQDKSSTKKLVPFVPTRVEVTLSLLMMMNASNRGEIWGTTVREYGE